MNQIQTQLLAMRKYALRQGKSEVVSAYTQTLGIVQPIHADKLRFKSDAMTRDKVAQKIALNTEALFR